MIVIKGAVTGIKLVKKEEVEDIINKEEIVEKSEEKKEDKKEETTEETKNNKKNKKNKK